MGGSKAICHDGWFIFSGLWIGNLFSIFILQALHVSAVQLSTHKVLQDDRFDQERQVLLADVLLRGY